MLFSTMFLYVLTMYRSCSKCYPDVYVLFFFGDIKVVHFESKVRFRYSFPRYQKRGSFSRIKVY